MINRREKLELSRLILAAKDGVLDKEHFIQLDRMIMNDPLAADYYVEFAVIYAALSQPSMALNSLIALKGVSEPQIDIRPWQELAEHEKDAKAVEVERVDEKIERVLTAEEREAKIQAFFREQKAMENEEKRLDEQAWRKKLERKLRRRQRAHKVHNVMRKVRRYTTIGAMAAMLMVIGYLLYVIIQPVPSTFVATLTDGIDIKWADPQQPTELGKPLKQGIMKLEEGFAQITFNDSGQIILEAPAEINLECDNRVYLQLGKLGVEIPIQGRGFKVNTPSASIIDLGTEFSVHVTEDGSSDIHVFEGKVSLLAGKIDKVVGKLFDTVEQIVEAGQAKRVLAGSSEIQDIQFDQTTFVRNTSSSYKLAVLRSRPTGYWRFGSDNRKRCLNLIDPDRHFAEYVGSTGFDSFGPDMGDGKPNDALKLDGQVDNYMLIENIESRWLHRGGFSLVLWLRADEIAEQNIITIGTQVQPDMRFACHLFMGDNGQLQYIMHSDNEGIYGGQNVETWIRSAQLVQKGRWHHVAVTLFRDHVRLFIDGRLEAESFEPIGQFDETGLFWYICTGADIESEIEIDDAPTINGAIDELAMYNRALSAEEIRRLYRSVGK